MLTTVRYGILNAYPILASVLTGRYYACRFAGGRVYLNVRESRFMLDRALGRHEPARMEAVGKLLKRGSIFIDIGGNKGEFALLAASKVGGSGKVFCFEPEPQNCRWIRESIRLNGYGNITLFELALSDSDGESRLYLGRRSGSHTMVGPLQDEYAGVVTVRTRTLDDLLSEVHQEKVDMMKIDVEGAELSVLKGAQRVLCQNSNIRLLIELHPHLGVNTAEVCDFLRGLGFSVRRSEAPFDAPIPTEGFPVGVVACRGEIQI
jgi:FkbM family methyltransferase